VKYFMLHDWELFEPASWLDRKPIQATEALPIDENFVAMGSRNWREWYDPRTGEYLGEVSARTGPDPVVTDQKCNCEVCNAGR
jgi:hypothetical protein